MTPFCFLLSHVGEANCLNHQHKSTKNTHFISLTTTHLVFTHQSFIFRRNSTVLLCITGSRDAADQSQARRLLRCNLPQNDRNSCNALLAKDIIFHIPPVWQHISAIFVFKLFVVQQIVIFTNFYEDGRLIHPVSVGKW